MTKYLVGFLAAVIGCACAQGDGFDLGSLVPLCSRDDPKIDECIVMSVDKLIPSLKKGIPELEVPALERLYLEEIVINPNGGTFRVIGKGITIWGITDFKVIRFKSDFPHNTFYIGVEFPFVAFSGDYEASIPTPMMKIKGSGPVQGNATNIRANGVLEGKIVKRGSQSYYQFKTLDLDVKIGDYKVFFRGMFPEKFLDEMAMNMINERSAELSWSVEPLAERAASSVLLDYINRITRHLPIEKMFT